MGKEFDRIAQEEFEFLATKFGFRLAKVTSDNFGYKLTYLNATTGVVIDYEIREAYVCVMLYQLVDGKLAEDPIFVHDDTCLSGYCLDDFVQLRNPSDKMRSAHAYGEDSEFHDPEHGLRCYVRRFADNLEKHAHDVLQGDFRVFGSLERVVKNRARRRRRREAP